MGPKRHHYLPRFYLKNFVNDTGLMWVFDRVKKEIRQQKIEDTAVQGHYYTFKDIRGGRNSEEIEKAFSIVEGRAKLIIDKLEQGREISNEEKQELAIYIAFQKTRVPDFEKTMDELSEKMLKKITEGFFSSEEKVLSQIKRYEEETGDNIKFDPKKIMQFVDKGEYSIKFPREHSIKAMIQQAEGIAVYFSQMNWMIMMAPKKSSFITSDNPLALAAPLNHPPFLGVGIATPKAQKFFPLSKKNCLVMGDYGNNLVFKQVDRKIVRAVNSLIAVNSDRFAISHEKDLLEKIIKITKINEWTQEERVQVS